MIDVNCILRGKNHGYEPFYLRRVYSCASGRGCPASLVLAESGVLSGSCWTLNIKKMQTRFKLQQFISSYHDSIELLRHDRITYRYVSSFLGPLLRHSWNNMGSSNVTGFKQARLQGVPEANRSIATSCWIQRSSWLWPSLPSLPLSVIQSAGWRYIMYGMVVWLPWILFSHILGF